MEQPEPTLMVVTVATKPSGLRGPGEEARKIIEQGIPLDKLQQSFARFLQSLQKIVNVEQARVGDFVLDEITFSAEVGADGEFKLLGAGVGVSANSGVSFTLRRQPAKEK